MPVLYSQRQRRLAPSTSQPPPSSPNLLYRLPLRLRRHQHQTVTLGLRKQRDIIRRTSLYHGEYSPGHPPFAASTAAACREFYGPLPKDISDIVYTAYHDVVIEQWIR